MHVSADRKRAYGISIPRDSLVTRPECKTKDGETIPGGTDVMWNEAFSVGGPACTIQQFEQITGVRVDHFVVVDFAGFEDMVDAIGGVEVCIPEDISDPAHGINIPAGTREIAGREALNYVRARYTLGDGSDIGRISRQQAFIASMVNKVKSAGVLARPDRLIRFLEAATKSLTVDKDLSSIAKIADLALQFQDTGLDKIKFITVPWEYDQREEYAGPGRRGCRRPTSSGRKIAADEPLTKRLTSDAINAAEPPGSATVRSGSGSPNGSPSARRRRRPRRSRPRRTTSDCARDRHGRAAARASEQPAETDWERRKRLAAVFGDVLPETHQRRAGRRRAVSRRDQAHRRVAALPGPAPPRLSR